MSVTGSLSEYSSLFGGTMRREFLTLGMLLTGCILFQPALCFGEQEQTVGDDNLRILIEGWHESPGYDLTGDGITDDGDIFYLLSKWRSLQTFGIEIRPASATIASSATQEFSIVGTGYYPDAVLLTVDGVSGGNETVGTIDANGLYTAPATYAETPIQTHLIEAFASFPLPSRAEARVTVVFPEIVDMKGFVTALPVSYRNEPIAPNPMTSIVLSAKSVGYRNRFGEANPVTSARICAKAVGYRHDPVAIGPVVPATIVAKAVGYRNEPVADNPIADVVIGAKSVGYKNGEMEAPITNVTVAAAAVGYSNI